MEERSKIRVFMVDDHELIRRGIREALEDEPDMEVVGEAASGKEALALISHLNPDVALIDVRLPDIDGIRVCKAVKERHPGVECVILTSYNDDQILVDAIKAGAAGYLLKESKVSEMAQAIRRVAAGQSILDAALIQRVMDRLRRGSPEDRKLATLTEQERKILDLLAEGLADREIGARLFLAEKTVRNYVSQLLSKLDMPSRTAAAVYAVRLQERRRRDDPRQDDPTKDDPES